MRVLVSGGEFETRGAVADTLRGAGASVSEAAGAPEALRLMSAALHRSELFALVVDMAGGLAERAATAFPEGTPPMVRADGPSEALAALRALAK